MTSINEKIQVPFPVGLKVTKVRWMTEEEFESEGWDPQFHRDIPVIEFNDGSKMYASSDPEGNDPGILFGCTEDNQQCYIVPMDMINQEGKK